MTMEQMNAAVTVQRVVTAMQNKKAQQVVILDVQALTPIVDYFVVCHGNSEPQVQAIVQEIRRVVLEAGGTIRGIEGLSQARWVLIDLGDVVVHVFHREERDYYHVERLWADARRTEVSDTEPFSHEALTETF